MKHVYNHPLPIAESAKTTRHEAEGTILSCRRANHSQVAASLPATLPFRPTGTLSRTTSANHKTPLQREASLLEFRKTSPSFGARRLIRHFDPRTGRAPDRIWREHDRMPKCRRKYQRRQDLAHIKASWASCQQSDADTKDLNDIPHCWLQAKRIGLS